jgi:hypothetical protein
MALSDPRQRLLAVIDGLFECFAQDGNLLWIQARGPQELPWKIRQTMGERTVTDFHRFNAWVAERVRDVQREGGLSGLDADVVAASILGSVTNASTQCAETGGDRPLAELAAPVRALFQRVIESQETQ